MRHTLIKITNSGLLFGFMLLLVLLPRTTDPDLAPPGNLTFVSADTTEVGSSEDLYVSKITPVQKTHLIWRVEWSDGKKKVLWPCKYEDSPRCYWQADTMGNGVGTSFIHARKRVWFINYYAD